MDLSITSMKLNHLPIFLAVLCITFSSLADVTLPAVFGNKMVLQRDIPLHVWGTAEAGEKITVTFDQHNETVTADAEGNWIAGLPSLSADGGKPHKLTVKGNNEIVLEDILVGDVWIGSGQSNMEWQLKNTDKGAEFIAAASHPRHSPFPHSQSSKK